MIELKTGILDVHTVQEGSEILVLDDCGLLDSGAKLRDILEVNSLYGDVVLLFFLLAGDDSFRCVNSLVHFESQKVFNFDCLDYMQSTLPFSMTLTTMGKWEQARTILNLYPTVTPCIMFLMVLLMVPITAFLFFFWSHILKERAFFLVLSETSLRIYMGTWLNLRLRVPSFPLTTTSLALTLTSTPYGISNSCSATMYFMTTKYIKYNINILAMPSLKPGSIILQLFFSLCVIAVLFLNTPLVQQVCPAFTRPPSTRTHLAFALVFVQIIRVLYPVFMKMLSYLPFLSRYINILKDKLIVKYLIVLIIKGLMVYQNLQLNRYYLHCCFLQITTLLIAAALDILHKNTIRQAGQLLLLQSLNRLTLIYCLTQTFCPAFVLYYAVPTLLIFINAMIQGQAKDGLKNSLYVKHDIYRFFFMTLIFYVLFSIIQLTRFQFKNIFVLAMSATHLIKSLRLYNQGIFKQSQSKLFWGCMIIIFWQFTIAYFNSNYFYFQAKVTVNPDVMDGMGWMYQQLT